MFSRNLCLNPMVEEYVENEGIQINEQNSSGHIEMHVIEANKNLDDLEFIVKSPFRLKALVTNIQKICNNKKIKLIASSLEDMCVEDFDQKFFLNVINLVLNNDENGILKKDYN